MPKRVIQLFLTLTLGLSLASALPVQSASAANTCVKLGVGVSQGLNSQGGGSSTPNQVCGSTGQDLISNYIFRLFNWAAVAIGAVSILRTRNRLERL